MSSVVLLSLAAAEERQGLGGVGRRKALGGFKWKRYARTVEADCEAALGRPAASTK